MPRKRKTPAADLDDEKSGSGAPLPLKRSARNAAKLEAGSAAASSKPVSRSGGDEPRGALSSSDKSLSDEVLRQEVTKIAKNEARAELMLLELMRTYSFNFPRLKELLTRKLISFESRVWFESN